MSGAAAAYARLPEASSPNLKQAIQAIRKLEDEVDEGSVHVRSVPLPEFRVHDAVKTDLPDTPSADDLGLAEAVGSAIVGVETNGGGTATSTGYALALIPIPADYIAGGTLTLRARAKVTNLSEVSEKIDCEVKKVGDAAVGSDICATAEQDLTAAYANYDFTITPTGLTPGDILQVRLKLATNDTGGTQDATPSIAKVELRYQGRLGED